MGLFQSIRSYGNIEVKDYCIRYVEIKSHNPIKVERCEIHFLPNGIISKGRIVDFDGFQQHLEQCVDEWGLKRKKIRFLAPDTYVVVRKTEISKEIKEDEISGHLYFELGSTIHLPFENPTIDYVVIGEDEEEREVLLFATPEDVIYDYISAFEDVKLKTIAVDISPLCVYRFLEKSNIDLNVENEFMILQVNTREMILTVFKENAPLFTQQIDFTYEQESWDISHIEGTMTWTGEHEELIRNHTVVLEEIERVARYYQFTVTQGKGEVKKIMVTGDHPALSEYVSLLQPNLSQKLVQLEVPMQLQEEVPVSEQFLPIIGLAVKEVK